MMCLSHATHLLDLHTGRHSAAPSQNSSQDSQSHTPSHQPSDETSVSHEGFWQRETQRQQESATGTWDFETDPSSLTGQPTGASSGHDYDKQMLYIQMEFCPRTLKKILVAGPIEEADAWQVSVMCSHSH